MNLTGGAGFNFEDCIAAYFMIHLLSNTPPLECDFGVVVSIDWQVSESGWSLDDLLITCKGSNEVLRRLAISIKRDKQVTRKGFPTHFVEAIWKHWLNTQTNPFVKDRDRLCLAVGELADSVKSAWDKMLAQALRTSSERMVKRLSPQSKSRSNSKIQRDIFNSLHCPAGLKQGGNTEKIDTARLLKHIRLLHYDFQSPQSNAEKEAIRLCKSCLHSGSTDEAKELWGKLIAFAANLRAQGGTMDRSQLIRTLHKFRLAEFPDFRSDWTILQRVSKDAMAGIRTEIGRGIEISRKGLIDKINENLNKLRRQVLLGESGSGKSALVKTIARSNLFDRVVWLTGDHLNAPGLHSVSGKLGLTHDLVELLQSTGDKKALLVFDAIEKFSPDCLRIMAKLIDSLKLEKEDTRWFVILTSQPLNWMTTQQTLNESGLKLTGQIVSMVELPDQQELTVVYHKLPKIRPLLLRPGLQKLLNNLKILDWAAWALDNEQPVSSQWFGESNLIDWLWKKWIKTGVGEYAGAGLLKKIGEKEAQSFAGGVPLSDLTVPEYGVLSELKDLQLLKVKEERVYFTHDLLGDWSRLHILIELNELERVEKLKNRAENPRWHQAIRLFGLRTLEQEVGEPMWYRLHQSLNDGSIYGTVAADLVLEAVALSTNASVLVLLERVWPHLSNENGVLLNTLIKRFCHIASFPDPKVQSIANDDDSKIRFSASFRIPYWQYWKPMLTFLHSHANEVKKIAYHSISELCLLWLSQVPIEVKPGVPFSRRHEAAELALLAAREVQGQKAEGAFFCNDIDMLPYEAFLWGAPELQEKVSALALELAQRRPPAPEILQRSEASDKRRSEEHEKLLQEDPEYSKKRGRRSQAPRIPSLLGRRLPPWPDGPNEKIDEAFRKVCTKKQALYFLMKYQPEVAKEVLLALCIEPPTYQYYQRGHSKPFRFATSHDNEEIILLHRPFLLFLQTTPTTAIELVVKLVNFATERWLERNRKPARSNVDNDINEEQTVDLWIDDNKYKWIGDDQVFGWYRSCLIDANYVVSALMALEQWFYDEIDAGRDVTEWINKVFKESKSTAFAGVLVALAKKHPELLLNSLKPILSIWQVFSWDFDLIQSDLGILIYGGNIGEVAFNKARDWDQLPHRKIELMGQVISLMPSSHELRLYLTKIIKKWHKSLSHKKDQDIEFTIELLNPANYKISNDNTGNMPVFECPEHLKDYVKNITESRYYTINIDNFPIYCQKILEGNQPLDSDNLEQHWKTLRYFADSSEAQDQDVELYHTAVMGGIAVLVILHSRWLRNEPEKEQWCEDQIQQIINKEHSKNTPGFNFGINWKYFLGEIAVWSLAENGSDKKARGFLFQSVFTTHYKTIEHICKISYQKRAKLGEDFGRILNLCRLWAGISSAIGRCGNLKIRIAQLQTWHNEARQSYENCTLQVNPIPLYEIVEKAGDIIREAELKYDTEHESYPFPPEQVEEFPNPDQPGLNWQVLQAAYSWIPELHKAANEDERKQWIAFHRELLDLELTYLRNARRDSRVEIDGTPYAFEGWIFSLLVRLIPKLRANEKPEEFWQPIFDLGAAAHSWVDAFLSTWFGEGPKVVSNPKEFASIWRSMIQYALNSNLWRNDYFAPCYYRLDELHIQLMGLGFCAEIIGQEEYSETITGLISLYEQWAEEWLKKAYTADAFAIFLLKPAANHLIIHGLKWLAKGIKQIHQDQWKFCSLSDSLMSLLCACWEKYRSKIENTPDVKSAFSEILNLLISQNNPTAMELRDQIVQSASKSRD